VHDRPQVVQPAAYGLAVAARRVGGDGDRVLEQEPRVAVLERRRADRDPGVRPAPRRKVELPRLARAPVGIEVPHQGGDHVAGQRDTEVLRPAAVVRVLEGRARHLVAEVGEVRLAATYGAGVMTVDAGARPASSASAPSRSEASDSPPVDAPNTLSGQHHPRADQVVGREAVGAAEEAEPAAQSEPGDPPRPFITAIWDVVDSHDRCQREHLGASAIVA
jgi:hypothetical protein